MHPGWLTAFETHTGRAVLFRSYWEDFEDFYEVVKPVGDELWVTNGRINEVWQSGYDDVRRLYHAALAEPVPRDPPGGRPPAPGRIGRPRRIQNDHVLVQTGGDLGVDDNELTFTQLHKAGHIGSTVGSFTAVAIVTDRVRRGVTFAYFGFPGNPANSVVPGCRLPLSTATASSWARGRIVKLGESPFKRYDRHELRAEERRLIDPLPSWTSPVGRGRRFWNLTCGRTK